jgi:predicted DCC family thiol-disulfide oxidoreductase YuxK
MDLLHGPYSRKISRFIFGCYALAQLLSILPNRALAFKLSVAAAAVAFILGLAPRFGAGVLAAIWLFADALELASPIALADAVSSPLAAWSLLDAWASRPGHVAGFAFLLWFCIFDRSRERSKERADRQARRRRPPNPATTLQWAFLGIPALTGLADSNLAQAAVGLGFLALAAHRPLRPWAALAAGIAGALTTPECASDYLAYLFLGFAAYGEHLLRPAKTESRAKIYYDERDALWRAAIEIFKAENHRDGLLFCALGTPQAAIELGTATPRDLAPIALKETGTVLFRSAATLRALALLGGWWRALSAALSLIPRSKLEAAARWALAHRDRLAF